ncbi:YeiH family protein [Deinococcus carri]
MTLAVAALSMLAGNAGWGRSLGFSTLTLAIVLGMLLGNTVYPPLSPVCQAGVTFSKGTLLQAGIILYGFRLTFQQLLGVGAQGLLSAVFMLVSTFLLAFLLGRWLKLDRQSAVLIGAGSSICGAAAVLATEPVVKAKAEQVTVAVATVVIFGTISIFLYPAMNALHLWPFSGQAFGIYIGSSVHEVAQVVAAGKAISAPVADAAVTTKLLRVMLLAPFLLLLSAWWNRRSSTSTTGSQRQPITVPWFAFGFIGAALFNSLHLLPASAVSLLLNLDTLLLTMAMAALGLTTHLRTLRQAGVKPLILGSLLMVWLVVGGGLFQWLLALSSLSHRM